MWGKLLQYLLTAVGYPIARYIVDLIASSIKKWLEKIKDKKDVKQAEQEGQENLDKLKKAKENNDENAYNDAIDNI